MSDVQMSGSVCVLEFTHSVEFDIWSYNFIRTHGAGLFVVTEIYFIFIYTASCEAGTNCYEV